MKAVTVPASLVDNVQALIEQAEAVRDVDPAMGEAAAMVYVGDVYALRETLQIAEDAGWGTRRYAGDFRDDPL
ncbi:MAG: hypothetical protein ACE5LB_07230 [Acidiferrobacterales bacterium]